MIRERLLIAVGILLLAGADAHAEMYRYRDPETGRIKLTNVPPFWMKGAGGPRVEVIRYPPSTASPATSSAQAAPGTQAAPGGTSAVAAPPRPDASALSVSAQAAPWELRFPRDQWSLQQTKRRPDGQGDYYLFSNPRTQLNLSFFIEPATRCTSAAECRNAFWSNAGAQFKNPQTVEHLEEHGFAVVRFVVPEFEGVRINQLNYSAHAVRDGYWVSLRLSKVLAQDADRQLMSDFVKSVSFVRKSDAVPDQR
jgi:hypothetical protein